MILSILFELATVGLLVLVGIGISLQPGAVLAGNYVNLMERERAFRGWALIIVGIAVYAIVLLMMVGKDWIVSTYLGALHSPRIFSFYSSFELVKILVFASLILAILQLSQLLGLTHGERDLQFHYAQMRHTAEEPTWCERYIAMKPRSLRVALIKSLYLFWAPRWSLWPYGIWLLALMGIGSDGIITDVPLLITAVMVGYMIGHHFHGNESRMEGKFVWLRCITPWIVVIHLGIVMVSMLLVM